MTTAAAKTTGADIHQKLDKRRMKWLATMQAVAEAEGALAGLTAQLDTTVRQREADVAELKAAVERKAELRKHLKSLTKQHERLRSERKRAKAAMKKARRRAKVSEAKFDKSLLADMLRKARTTSLATAAGTAAAAKPTETTNGTPRRTATPSRRRSSSSTAAPTRRTASANGRAPRS